MFLVKWKDRPFKDATWEKDKDINNDLKIGQFRIFQTPPTKSNYKTALQKAKKKAKLKMKSSGKVLLSPLPATGKSEKDEEIVEKEDKLQDVKTEEEIPVVKVEEKIADS